MAAIRQACVNTKRRRNNCKHWKKDARQSMCHANNYNKTEVVLKLWRGDMEDNPDLSGVCLSECELQFSGQPYSVCVLKPGYCDPQPDGTFRADGTITLITGPKNILVDTGGPWDRDLLLQRLEERGLGPGDVHVVVGTHGHSDHIGNLSLFHHALLIVGFDVCEGDTYKSNMLAQGDVYELDEHVSVVPSPGHSGQDVSVQVKGTSVGTVLVAGDLFERCSNEDSWRDVSLDPALQQTNRQRALQSADVIIPGHGLPFRVSRGKHKALS